MRSRTNFNPSVDYMIINSEIRIDDDGYLFLEFEEVDFDIVEFDFDYNQMLADATVEARVFNELFLKKEIEFMDVFETDLSYPLYV